MKSDFVQKLTKITQSYWQRHKDNSVDSPDHTSSIMNPKTIELGLMWVSTIYGTMKLSDWVLLATLVYTLIRIVGELWDRFSKRKPKESVIITGEK